MPSRKLRGSARRGLTTGLALLLLLGGCAAPLPDLSSLTGPTNLSSGSGTTLDQYARQVLTLTNQERAKKGLTALQWNDRLAQAAADHCQDMINRNYFAHESPSGSNPGDRATAAGYQWSWIGENIAMGYTSPQAVVDGWMNSSEHRANILRPEFTELGVGVRTAADGRLYWGQLFGTPLSNSVKWF